jgi:hypothetical protein
VLKVKMNLVFIWMDENGKSSVFLFHFLQRSVRVDLQDLIGVQVSVSGT